MIPASAVLDKDESIKTWVKYQAWFNADGRSRSRTFNSLREMREYLQQDNIASNWRVVRIDRIRKDILWLDNKEV